MLTRANNDNGGGLSPIDFQTFTHILQDKIPESDPHQQMTAAFHELADKRTGRISFRHLKKVSQELGENLSDR